MNSDKKTNLGLLVLSLASIGTGVYLIKDGLKTRYESKPLSLTQKQDSAAEVGYGLVLSFSSILPIIFLYGRKLQGISRKDHEETVKLYNSGIYQWDLDKKNLA